MDAIRTQGLTRRFDSEHSIIDLDLLVPAGGVYGFRGPNGSGKTTTIRLLLGLLRPQSGSIALFGKPAARIGAHALERVSALVDSPSLYPHLSGRDNLEVTRRLLGAPRTRIDAALERVGLRRDAQRKVAHYSRGMRQRLGLALALLNEPRLLILDEPGNGLDPAGTLDMRVLVRSLPWTAASPCSCPATCSRKWSTSPATSACCRPVACIIRAGSMHCAIKCAVVCCWRPRTTMR